MGKRKIVECLTWIITIPLNMAAYESYEICQHTFTTLIFEKQKKKLLWEALHVQLIESKWKIYPNE